MDSTWYWVPVFLFLMCSLFIIAVLTMNYVDEHSDRHYRKPRVKQAAKKLLYSFILIPASFMWPVAVPLALAFGIFRIIQDARRN